MITLEIKQAVKLPGLDNVFVSFSEAKPELVEQIRQLPARYYNSKERSWEVPMGKFESVLEMFKNEVIEIKFNNQTTSQSSIPSDFVFKMKPFEHQVVGIEYGLNHLSWILGDEMGLGKTYTVINLALVRKKRGEIKHCLIICGVNTLKYTWESEIKKYSNESCHILGTRYRKNGNAYMGTTQDKIEDIKTRDDFFLITNCETFVSDEFVKALMSRDDIEMVAVDECHKMNNGQSKRGKNFLKTINLPKFKVAITGTPILNSPLDAFAILKWLGVEKSNFSTFKSFYCAYGGFGGHELRGYKNLNVLKQSLEHCMLRRLKSEVLDLPPKIYQVQYLEMSQAQAEIYEEARKWVLENIDLISAYPNPLSQLLRLRQATGYTGILSSTVKESCKFDRIDDMMEEISSSGSKALIFSNWTSITTPLVERLAKYNPAVITGETPTNMRKIEEQRFQTDPECKVCIGTIGAMGTGITLTAASTVIFCDLPWHQGNKQQAEDRAHRIGTKGTVNVIYLCCKGTIDEKIGEIVDSKGKMADMLVDGDTSHVDKNFLLQLLE